MNMKADDIQNASDTVVMVDMVRLAKENERLRTQNAQLRDVMGLVMAEWDSDPRSTQCFSRFIIDKARAALAQAKETQS